MTTALQNLTQTLATKLDMGDGTDLIETLKATAFKGEVSDAQMTALLVVANQYKLNPWTKEIYAFPDKQNGIVPVVGVDGWARIINTHPQFDGMDFDQNENSCTCIIYRKDRNHPIKVTEYMDECYRPAFKSKQGYEVKGPWQSHPKRMLRHKAMIQCARLAFGYGGIYDQDEAERITEEKYMGQAEVVAPTLPTYSDEQFLSYIPKWRESIASGKTTAERIINMVSSKYTLTDEQIYQIKNLEPQDDFVAEMEAADAAN